jgi:hypothetical protein
LVHQESEKATWCKPLIVETPDMIEGQNEYSTIKAFGQEVAACLPNGI